MTEIESLPGVQLRGAILPGYAEILTPEALGFVVGLQRKFNGERLRLLERRKSVQAGIDAGDRPGFPVDTARIREDDCRRRCRRTSWIAATEITGPVDRKMSINALNSGASVFMADFEDLTSFLEEPDRRPDHLRDAIRGTIDYTDPTSGRATSSTTRSPRCSCARAGWHLPEAHVLVDGAATASAARFQPLLLPQCQGLAGQGLGPLFLSAQDGVASRSPAVERGSRRGADLLLLGLPQGTIKATVLIETILASFELDEILWELRQHSAGLNCGRWDYIFSFIKKFPQPALGRAAGSRPGHHDHAFCAPIASWSFAPAIAVPSTPWAA